MSNKSNISELSPAEAESTLKSNLQHGLTEDEVKIRLGKDGPNEIPEKQDSLASRIFRRFWGPIPWMIEAAAILSAVVGKWEDFSIIMVLLLLNVYIDFRQESKAQDALKLLKEKLAQSALALRGGGWSEIPASDLVAGDIVKLRIGNIIPADVMLMEGDYILADQAALTGESLPVNMKVGEIAYANSVVKKGEMLAMVTETGPRTFFGKTVALVNQASLEQQSHFQKSILSIGNFLLIVAAIAISIIIVTGFIRHDPFMEILRFALVLTVASIPVALPAVLSVTLAVGALRLAKHKAIVSHLVAIEELAGVDILCTDKTGTLTQNRMTLGDPVLYNEASNDDLIYYAALASQEENQDPLEIPIFSDAKKSTAVTERLRDITVSHFTPFDPVGKRTEAAVDTADQGSIIVTKGAPQTILNLCDDSVDHAEVSHQVTHLANKGYRTLGVAWRSDSAEKFQFIGLLSMFDPPRIDSHETIAEAKRLGLEVKMITGDHLAIAHQIADKLDIPGDIHDHETIQNTKPEDKLQLISDSGGFAQVFPEDKYLIVDELQKDDHIVGMTGDGVNDAPALKKADIGIAVSGATDAARAAADLVLTLPGLSVIIRAIEEARAIFHRMQSYAIFRIAETIRVILFMTLAIVVFDFYPVTAIMIILLALLNDLPIMTIAYDNSPVEPEPVRWKMKEIITLASVLGILGVVASFALFYVLENALFGVGVLTPAVIQTLIFLKLDIAGHSTLYVVRSGSKHFWQRPWPSWPLMVATISTMLTGTLIAVYGVFMEPIGWKWAGVIWAYAMAWFLLENFIKVFFFRILRKDKEPQLPNA